MRRAGRVLAAALTVAALLFAGRAIAGQWRAFRATGAGVQLHWDTLALSALVVVGAYAVLIETWRRTVERWGARLAWGDAARIWFISNLGRYLPGKVWQVGAMGAMAHARGVSPVAATGSAIVINLVNLVAGAGVVAACGVELLPLPIPIGAVAALLGLALALLPWIVRLAAAGAARLLRRPVDLPALPAGALWIAAFGCTVAWLLYGIGFRLLVAGVLGEAPGALRAYVAAFTGSYVVGYIVLFAPGGIGVREGSLLAALGRLGLAAGGAAGVIAVASRLWLTVLELLPGLALLLVDLLRRRPPSSRPDAPNA